MTLQLRLMQTVKRSICWSESAGGAGRKRKRTNPAPQVGQLKSSRPETSLWRMEQVPVRLNKFSRAPRLFCRARASNQLSIKATEAEWGLYNAGKRQSGVKKRRVSFVEGRGLSGCPQKTRFSVQVHVRSAGGARAGNKRTSDYMFVFNVLWERE